MGRIRPRKKINQAVAVALTLALLAATRRGCQRQNGKEGKRHAFKIVKSQRQPEKRKTVLDKHNGNVKKKKKSATKRHTTREAQTDAHVKRFTTPPLS